jgi:type II secretory pathway component PulF
MNFIFTYRAQDVTGNTLQGSVFAENEDHAYGKIKRFGLKAQNIQIDWNATVSHWTNRGFDTRELITFYRQLGLRLKKADNIDNILRDSANFISDPALKLAVLEAANHRGKNLGERLLIAGFEKSECEAIGSAMSEGGKNGYRIFETLSSTKKKESEMKARNKKMLRSPLMSLALLYVFLYGSLVYLAPMMLKSMKYQGVKLSDMMFLEPFYRFSIYIQDHMILFNIGYGMIPVILFSILRSRSIMDALTNWGAVARLKEVNSMILLWSQFFVLYQAGINIQQITKKVAGISDSMRFRMAFNNMGRKLADGKDISDSIALSDFPNYVRMSLSGAAKGDFDVGLADMLEVLEIDQTVMFEKIESLVGVLSKTIGMLVVAMLFTIVIIPQLLIFKSVSG